MRFAPTLAPTLALAALIALPVAAQDHSAMDHSAMDHAAADSPSTAAYRQAMERMHQDMAIDYSGNADADFIRGMIPHHQGAIDMARVVLEHGRDAQVRKLAEEIIKAQEAEIGMMQQWLREHDQAQ